MGKRDITIAEIRELLAQKNRQLSGLRAERRTLENRLKQVDRQIQRLTGRRKRAAKAAPKAAKAKARPRKQGPSLRQTILGAFAKAPGSLTIPEVITAVRNTGYTSSSSNFRKLISVTLAQMDELRRVARGKYALKKSAESAPAPKAQAKGTKKTTKKKARKAKAKRAGA